MTDRVEISKRMQVTFDPDISKTYLEVKTRNGWKKVWLKKAKRLRYKDSWIERVDRWGKISAAILLGVIVWALLK